MREYDEGEVDMGFINRALAESRRMRGEASQSHRKRADLAAATVARYGERSTQVMADAMAEHAAEVLSPEHQAALGMEPAEATGDTTMAEANASALS